MATSTSRPYIPRNRSDISIGNGLLRRVIRRGRGHFAPLRPSATLCDPTKILCSSSRAGREQGSIQQGDATFIVVWSRDFETMIFFFQVRGDVILKIKRGKINLDICFQNCKTWIYYILFDYFFCCCCYCCPSNNCKTWIWIFISAFLVWIDRNIAKLQSWVAIFFRFNIRKIEKHESYKIFKMEIRNGYLIEMDIDQN